MPLVWLGTRKETGSEVNSFAMEHFLLILEQQADEGKKTVAVYHCKKSMAKCFYIFRGSKTSEK
jgi:hypothetical protein